MKKLLSIGLAAAGLAVVAAGPAAAQIQERTIRVSNGVNETHPNGAGVAAMSQCAAQRSGGKIKFQAFWGGALGGDLQATQALRAGTQEMVVTSSSPLVGILPALGVFDLPFLFANEQEADKVLDGPFGKYIADMLPAVGLVNLAYWENGFRNTTNSRRPIAKWEDFQGVKMRVMQNNIFLDTFRNMNATATPMAFGEVFSALETRAIDGQENPFVTIDTSKFHEVQKFLSITNHAYTPFLTLYSKPLWDKLSGEEQKILTDCAIVGQKVERERNRSENATALSELKKRGMQVNELSPAEQTRMRERAAAVYERHGDQIGKEVVSKLLDELKKIRAGG